MICISGWDRNWRGGWTKWTTWYHGKSKKTLTFYNFKPVDLFFYYTNSLPLNEAYLTCWLHSVDAWGTKWAEVIKAVCHTVQLEQKNASKITEQNQSKSLLSLWLYTAVLLTQDWKMLLIDPGLRATFWWKLENIWSFRYFLRAKFCVLVEHPTWDFTKKKRGKKSSMLIAEHNKTYNLMFGHFSHELNLRILFLILWLYLQRLRHSTISSLNSHYCLHLEFKWFSIYFEDLVEMLASP